MALPDPSLPPPNSLVAFEAAARHQSITLAAAELNVTGAAISRQVRKLETHLGCALFERFHRRVRLTPQGLTLHRALFDGLSQIGRACRELAVGSDPRQVTVGSTIAFASLWLMPRIAGFSVANPDIALRYIVADRLVDRLEDDLDLVVLYGPGDWPGYASTLLFGDDIIPVCSPGYRAERPEMRTPADLLAERLIHTESDNRSWETWPIWFAKMGITEPARGRSERFNNYMMALQAAIDSHGVMLGWRGLITDHLARGTLVPAVPGSVPAAGGYYQLLPMNRPASPATTLLRDWIEAQARAIRPMPG
jgi:LysR family glycine cleavage system transcriptional activator